MLAGTAVAVLRVAIRWKDDRAESLTVALGDAFEAFTQAVTEQPCRVPSLTGNSSG